MTAADFEFIVESELRRGVGTIDPNSVFCKINALCSCDGVPITPDSPEGPNFIGDSGTEYQLVSQFADLTLPPGAFTIRYVCKILGNCCALGAAGSGANCGDIVMPCLIGTPNTVPREVTIDFAVGDCQWSTVVTWNGFNAWVGPLGGPAGEGVAVVLACDGRTSGVVLVSLNFPGNVDDLNIPCDVVSNCPLVAFGTGETLHFRNACGGIFLDVSIGGGSSGSSNNNDGVMFLGLFAEVFYPTPPELLVDDCEVEPVCECPPGADVLLDQCNTLDTPAYFPASLYLTFLEGTWVVAGIPGFAAPLDFSVNVEYLASGPANAPANRGQGWFPPGSVSGGDYASQDTPMGATVCISMVPCPSLPFCPAGPGVPNNSDLCDPSTNCGLFAIESIWPAFSGGAAMFDANTAFKMPLSRPVFGDSVGAIRTDSSVGGLTCFGYDLVEVAFIVGTTVYIALYKMLVTE